MLVSRKQPPPPPIPPSNLEGPLVVVPKYSQNKHMYRYTSQSETININVGTHQFLEEGPFSNTLYHSFWVMDLGEEAQGEGVIVSTLHGHSTL